MLKTFFATDRSWTLLLQRLALGIVIFPHGMQKLLGWFGGYGFDGTMGYFASLGMPAILGVLVVIAESFGAIALVAGLCTRLAAVGVIATMIGAIALVHAPYGFLMNWGGAKGGEGFEFHLLAIALAIPLAVKGAGSYALDGVIARLLRTAHAHRALATTAPAGPTR